MKVHTGVLKEAGSDLRMCRDRIEALNDELRAVIMAVSDMKGIECCGKLKRISYDIEYSSYVMSEMSEVIGKVAEIYERNEEKVIEKRETSYLDHFAGLKNDPSIFLRLGNDDYVQANPEYAQLASLIGRFF